MYYWNYLPAYARVCICLTLRRYHPKAGSQDPVLFGSKEDRLRSKKRPESWFVSLGGRGAVL